MKKNWAAFFILFFLLTPVFVFSQEPQACPSCEEPGGLVPCGRTCDDPSTSRNECAPCRLCDFFVLAHDFIDFNLRAFAIPALIIMIVGLTLVAAFASKFKPETLSKAKKTLAGVFIGLLFLYGSWVLVNSVLVFLGVASWSGLANWWQVDCPTTEELVLAEKTFCGDNIIQQPNNDGGWEKCDGTDLFFQNCESRGYKSGILKCLADCSDFDYSGCVAFPVVSPIVLSLPTATPLNPIPLEPAPAPKNQTFCNFDGTWTYNDDGAGNDFSVTCHNGVITGFCSTPCVGRGFHRGVYCCETSSSNNGVGCVFDGTRGYNDEGGGNDFAFTCHNGVITGFCGHTCVRRGFHRAVYCCENKSSDNSEKYCGPTQIACNFDGTWAYNDAGSGNDFSLTCRNGTVTGFCGKNCVSRGLHRGVYCCEESLPAGPEEPESFCDTCTWNIFGSCEEAECDSLGDDCAYVSVATLAGGWGNMCISENDCSACGTALGDTCTALECQMINSELCVFDDTDPGNPHCQRK